MDDIQHRYRRPLVIKSELVQIIAGRDPHLFVKDVEKVVDAILDEITGALSNGDRVELRGFGAFTIKHRPSHVARDPRMGHAVEIVEKWVPAFKAGKGLRDRLNGGD
jgi:integration host factor subunit beta